MGLIPAIYRDLVSNGKGGCLISDTTLRAISIEQLERLVEHVDSRLDAGEELAYTPSYPGAPLRSITKCIPMKRKTEDGYGHEEYTTMDANLYDMDALIIRPATKGRECSLVELMAEGEQPPDYFISHTWAEAVVKFLACVKQHSKVTAASYMCALSDIDAPGPRPREGDAEGSGLHCREPPARCGHVSWRQKSTLLGLWWVLAYERSCLLGSNV